MEFAFGKKDREAFERLLGTYGEAVRLDEAANEREGTPLSIEELKTIGAKKLETSSYEKDPYFQALLGLGRSKEKGIRLEKTTIEAYVPFLYDEERSQKGNPGLVERPFGYFERPFSYPSISSKGRIWMSLCPHEIETMKEAVRTLEGRILVLGLGLGYVPFLLSLKESVHEITVVDNDPSIIALFKKELLPRFPYGEKIRLVKEDALAYVSKRHPSFDGVFADLWHDQEDGFPLYWALRKHLDRWTARTAYWIEGTILLYVRMGLLILAEEELLNTDENDEAYLEVETQSDALVNALHFALKGKKVDSFGAFMELIGDRSLKNSFPRWTFNHSYSQAVEVYLGFLTTPFQHCYAN